MGRQPALFDANVVASHRRRAVREQVAVRVWLALSDTRVTCVLKTPRPSPSG